MFMKNLSPNALGLSLGILAAVHMLAISLAAMSGYYTGAYEAMKVWHMFYDLTAVGVLGGILEAFVWSYIAGAVFGWMYNRLA